MLNNETPVFTAYEEATGPDSAVAEKNLMRAILRSAVDDLMKNGEPYRQARKYVLSDDESYLFSFVNICRHLNICHRTLRARLGIGTCRIPEQLAA